MVEKLCLVFFLRMVTHLSGKTNLLLLELFSSVSLGDLFVEPQAFTANPPPPTPLMCCHE